MIFLCYFYLWPPLEAIKAIFLIISFLSKRKYHEAQFPKEQGREKNINHNNSETLSRFKLQGLGSRKPSVVDSQDHRIFHCINHQNCDTLKKFFKCSRSKKRCVITRHRMWQ